MKSFVLMLFCVCVSMLHAQWENEIFDWRNTKTVANGVIRAEWKVKSPRLIRIFAMRIDLNNPKLRFHVTPKADKYGETMPDAPEYTIRTRREPTRKFFDSLRKKKFRVVAAFNAAPWGPWKPPWTHTYADRIGFTVSDGVVVMPPNGKRPSFIVTADGKADLVTVAADADISHIKQAVSGFSFVLKDGKCVGNSQNLAPRTGYGISKDKRYFYVFVADGRQPEYSMGMTHKEVGIFLRYLGAYTGVNMDGGGSSSMVIRRKRKTVMLNQQPGKGERAVGVSLAVSIKK